MYSEKEVEKIERAIFLKGTNSERADDIPLIIHWLKQMEIASIIDQELVPPHGNRKGLSYGQLAVLFLTYVVSQSDHRLCAVEPWVEKHRQTLEMATGWNIRVKDATDDRLADLLSVIGSSEEKRRDRIALRLGQGIIRAYELPTDKARSDTTSFSVYHQTIAEAGREKLLNFGYSKDHRPDLVQYRQMLATLDPMGMPLLGATLSGNGTDESHYLPTWQKLVEIIGHKDFLFLADSKGSTWNNRAKIHQEGGIYCFPLAMHQPRPKLLSQWVANPPTALEEICLDSGDADSQSPIGQGFEVPLGSLWYDKEAQQSYCWSERWFVVCSTALPIYFQDEERIRGLMFLLTIALTLFTLMEFLVRRQLGLTQQSLSGLYPGLPKRQTSHPTAEKLLAAFSELTLYLYPDGSREITALNSLQRQILHLMKIPESIYIVPQLVPD